MPRSKYIHLRAMHEDFPEGKRRVRISCRNDVTNTYETFDVTRCGVLDQKHLERAIRDHYQDETTEIRWPQWATRKKTERTR